MDGPTYTVVWRYRGGKENPPDDVALARLIKELGRSYRFQCIEIIEGDWRERPPVVDDQSGETTHPAAQTLNAPD